ncbi:Phage integrase family protein [Salinihabitans flavidus]|uniref:Phage integrase family protein n=1 Tax=Salinihabitans flavidus TaxID=569882 RepID=A0A1H8T443_9RHOB|nr:site-specific integrase [Salinihabitans flavidus]SEO85575.1 Phage integrase family protein [Salinihabitans flavidus]
MAQATTLTEPAIKKMKAAPEGGRTDKPDKLAPGLFLRINAKGAKSWMCHFRCAGRQGKIALGHWPAMGVAEAREAAREVREQARAGVHPKAAREAARQAEAATATNTLKTVGEAYIEAMERGELVGARRTPVVPKTVKGRRTLLVNQVYPVLGDRPINEIAQPEVAMLLERISAKAGPVDRTLQALRLLYRFAISRGVYSGTPPTEGLSPRQAPQQKARALSDAELRATWKAALRWGFPYGSIFRLLALTGQRRGEIRSARWSDVDFDRRMLTIPAHKAKNRAGAHEVPLSAPALEVLTEARDICRALRDPTGFIFPNADQTGHVAGFSKSGTHLIRDARGVVAGLSDDDLDLLHSKGAQGAEARARKAALKDRIEAVPGWRIHDLRHTFVTRLRIGTENAEGETVYAVPLDVIQATVNHRLTAGITATYDHSDMNRRYRLRKREALDWWAARLMEIAGAEG